MNAEKLYGTGQLASIAQLPSSITQKYRKA
jgi:hypothetical protein